jgi:hypothetical protein
MKLYLNPLLSCICFIIFFCCIIIIPSSATSDEHLILQEGSHINWFDAHIDNNLIATYVKSSSPNEIKIYNRDGVLMAKIRLSNESSDIESLDINNGLVYYAERDTAIIPTQRLETVFEYNLNTGDKRPIYTTTAFNEHVTRIVADRENIVMRGGDDMNKIILHTLPEGKTKNVISSRYYITDLAIDGDHIVWGSDRTDGNPGREIHVYSVSTGIDSVIPDSVSIKTTGTCEISDDHVVWGTAADEMKYINGVPVWGPSSGGIIRLTDLSTGITMSLEKFDSYPEPFITGDYVFYNKLPAPNEDNDYDEPDLGVIRAYNIKTQKYFDLASGVGTIRDVDNGQVVWSKFRPVSFWLTHVPGYDSSGVSSIITRNGTKNQSSLQQNPSPAPESPVDHVIIISALTVGVAGCALQKKRE